jgi:DNA-binding transcriptional regulator LsrR (DeoR family)
MEDQVGTQAARLLLDNLKDSMTVALSWGHALQSMVYATTSDHEFHRISLVQLVGGLSSISNEISGQELVRELAVRLNAEYRFLHAPATLETAGSRDALLAEPSIRGALAEACRADLAFVGVGTPSHGSSSAILNSLNLSGKERKAFWAAEPVGDIAARYYDAAGHPIHGRGRRADPRHRARGPDLHPARRRASPTAARRPPASSARSGVTSSTHWSATRPSLAACSATPAPQDPTGGN